MKSAVTISRNTSRTAATPRRVERRRSASGFFIQPGAMPTTKETKPMDLSGMSMAELEAMVAQERDRRKREAYEAVKAVAEFRGLTMRDVAEMIGATKPKRAETGKKRAAFGTVGPVVLSMLRNGHSVREIAKEMGWQNSGPAYRYAWRAGIPMKHGRAAA